MPENTETTDEPIQSNEASPKNQISTVRRLAPQVV